MTDNEAKLMAEALAAFNDLKERKEKAQGALGAYYQDSDITLSFVCRNTGCQVDLDFFDYNHRRLIKDCIESTLRSFIEQTKTQMKELEISTCKCKSKKN